ncbi:glycosyltransferase [Helicobacter typhlonius]|uniref:Glycosyltransferase n=1 Tax=Helicobacter typhlonius TaxID=76936 RepID=A0A4U8S217_9HELI|nr:glycosyltransferase [Helicobacter typhlonius]HCD73729.1 hypothetical protein [Helicobacter sp.]
MSHHYIYFRTCKNVTIAYHKEIVIIDDCSTDGTIEILQDLKSTESNQNNIPHA